MTENKQIFGPKKAKLVVDILYKNQEQNKCLKWTNQNCLIHYKIDEKTRKLAEKEGSCISSTAGNQKISMLPTISNGRT